MIPLSEFVTIIDNAGLQLDNEEILLSIEFLEFFKNNKTRLQNESLTLILSLDENNVL